MKVEILKHNDTGKLRDYPVCITLGDVQHCITYNDAKTLWAMMCDVLAELKPEYDAKNHYDAYPFI